MAPANSSLKLTVRPRFFPPAEPAAASRICTASRHLHRHYRMRRKRRAARRRPPSGGPQFYVKTLDGRGCVRDALGPSFGFVHRVSKQITGGMLAFTTLYVITSGKCSGCAGAQRAVFAGARETRPETSVTNSHASAIFLPNGGRYATARRQSSVLRFRASN